MSLNADKKNRISEEIKKILSRRLKNFPDVSTRNRNAPFHDLILKSFKDRFRNTNLETPRLVAIASWMHGLNTSLGTGFENIAHILSSGYKRNFTGVFNLKVTEEQASAIENIIRKLKSGDQKPNIDEENKHIFVFNRNSAKIDSLGFTADVYIERKDEIICLEMKSVRPNSGEGRGEKQKILYGKASLKLANQSKKIRFLLGFPFDPTSLTATNFDKDRFFNHLVEFKKFFDPKEVLVASELWDFLNGAPNTMEDILDTIKDTIKQFKKANSA